MATADDDDEQILPNSLQKLEIVPIGVANKSLLSGKNPFYTIPLVDGDAFDEDNDDDDDNGTSANCNRTVKLFGPMCSKCENRVGGKDNALTARHTARSSSNNNSTEHSIQRPTTFKQRNKDKCHQNIEKNLQILREPILKCIGRSLHHHEHEQPAQQQQQPQQQQGGAHIGPSEPVCLLDNNEQILSDNSGSSNLVNNNTNGALNRHDVPTTVATQQATNSELLGNKKSWKLKKDAVIDFKSLVTDCSHLTLSSTSSIGGSLQLHRTKTFQTLQENDDSSAAGPSTSTGGVTGPDPNTMNISTSSNSSSASSTCSQQARMNTSNCDVTIDELASYFETFVHIPKKMSEMAEMMYI